MDHFLQDIYVSIYKDWILNHNIKGCKVEHLHKNHDSIRFISPYGKAEINFYAQNIVELSVYEHDDDEPKFYLHFQMNNMVHAITLFNEMIKSLLQLEYEVKTKILLCCTGGLTSSHFASKIQDVCNLLSLDFEIEATSYNQLFTIGQDYDVILLAPQISYNYTKVKLILKDKLILRIPPVIFAKYDVKGILTIVEEELSRYEKEVKEVKTLYSDYLQHIDSRILCISANRYRQNIHIAYRMYDHGKIIVNKENIKERITIEDICDVIDTMLLQYPEIEIIGLTVPGIINHGKVDNEVFVGIGAFDFRNYFKHRYKQQFVITNDVNTAVIGYDQVDPQYDSLAFLFQPIRSYAGAGILINHQLVVGKNNVAGEMQYLPGLRDKEFYTTPEKILEVVKKEMLSIISVIGPDAIVLYCPMIPHIQELKDQLSKEIPEMYIPNIIEIDDLTEFIFLGLSYLCYKEVSANEKKR